MSNEPKYQVYMSTKALAEIRESEDGNIYGR